MMMTMIVLFVKYYEKWFCFTISDEVTEDGGTSVEKEHACKRSWVERYLTTRDGYAEPQAVEELYRDLIRATAVRLK